MSSLELTREADLAKQWGLELPQFRALRRRHGWAHVRLSRQDIRYTHEQVEHIVHQMTVAPKPKAVDSGLTSRSAARSA